LPHCHHHQHQHQHQQHQDNQRHQSTVPQGNEQQAEAEETKNKEEEEKEEEEEDEEVKMVACPLCKAKFNMARSAIKSYTYMENELVAKLTRLVCPVCMEPLVDPIKTPCKHLFCRRCISDALARSPMCPIDRQLLKPSQLVPADKMVEQMLGELEVYCSNRKQGKKGCEWTGHQASLAKHLERFCKCVACPWAWRGCKFEGRQVEHVMHLACKCQHEDVPCPHGCGHLCQHGQLAQHTIVEWCSVLKAQQKEQARVEKEERLWDEERLEAEWQQVE